MRQVSSKYCGISERQMLMSLKWNPIAVKKHQTEVALQFELQTKRFLCHMGAEANFIVIKLKKKWLRVLKEGKAVANHKGEALEIVQFQAQLETYRVAWKSIDILKPLLKNAEHFG